MGLFMAVNVKVIIIWNVMSRGLLDSDILEEPTTCIFSVKGSSLLIPRKQITWYQVPDICNLRGRGNHCEC
jgi:hypothetical protein